MGIFRKKTDTTESDAAREHRLGLIDGLTFEVVPMKSLTGAIEHLPAGCEVSVTCSPAKGIAETQRITEDLVEQGYLAIPHISARMVRDRAHVTELAGWFRGMGIDRIFIVGGDHEEPGDYPGAVEFLRDLLDTDHGLQTIGVTAYPDGHAFLSDDIVRNALADKEQLTRSAGVEAYCSTQMCFDPTTIAKWMRQVREQGIEMPIHLGISGVVDKTKLLTMGARLGIGQSLSYLKKNKAAVARMLTATSYDPNDLLVPLSEDMLNFGVEGLHVFTFNQVEATNDWRTAVLAEG
ncbi:MAG: methylenetetrahydrofolate reductase [Actinomycetota bacterium]